MVIGGGARRGAGGLGCLVWVAVVAVLLYYGMHNGGVFLRYYELRDDMGEQARFASQISDAAIENRLSAGADSLLGESPDFRIERRGGRITITTRYTETVDLPFFRHTFVLTPRAESPL
jgi:hypothetical protein